MSPPDIIFGGALLGASSHKTEKDVNELLDQLQSLGVTRIDTAARYPALDPGKSESLLGAAGAAKRGLVLDTKIYCTREALGSLEPTAIEGSVSGSLNRLGVEKAFITLFFFNVLYCHRPDLQTPLQEQAAALNGQYKKGVFTKLGVSNFPTEYLLKFLAICEENGFVKPTVYQGQYNLICRRCEETLFPLLRTHGIVFNAYSPLAGGFLTGRLTRGEREGTRFEQGNPLAPTYSKLYDKKEMHDAILKLQNIIEPLSITGPEASLRWMFYHSMLREDDGVIIGASKSSQLSQNISDIRKGPLPVEVVQAMNDLWVAVAEHAPELVP